MKRKLRNRTLIVLLLLSSLIMPDRTASAESYWLRGGLIGAGVGAGGTTTASVIGCDYGLETSDQKAECLGLLVPLSVVVGGGVGFGIGAAIGSAFKKNKPAVTVIMDPTSQTYGLGITNEF